MVASSYGDVSVAVKDHVAEVEIHRPPFNHVSVDLMRSLADAFNACDAEGIRAIVLCTEGKAFCGGADLVARDGLASGKPTMVNPLYVEAVRLFSCVTPIIAAVQGAAIGAGLGLALVADFRIAAPEARFGANFVKLGFHPGFGLSHTLPRLIGLQRANLMFQTGRRIKAEEALQWGLADELAPLAELRAVPMRLPPRLRRTRRLPCARRGRRSGRGLAAAVKAMTDHEFAEQAVLMKTADFAEGVRAVNERRAGNFTGK